jgi:hypothetical protein
MNIEFFPVSELAQLVVPPPKPAKSYIPQWYKDVKLGKDPTIGPRGGLSVEGQVKKCVPFLDALMYGYIQESWTDIYVKKNKDGIVEFTYAIEPTIIRKRQEQSIKISKNFYPLEFIWQVQWKPILPKGWSVMLTHPLNRLDLPFQTLTGVIDADVYNHGTNGNFPFYMENDFEGVIPVGTPLYQIIPIKRDNWKSSTQSFDYEDITKKHHEVRKYFSDAYRKLFWQKKSFE